MTTTNYLSPEDFKKMVDAIPLVTEYNKSKLLSVQKERVPDPKLIQACAWVEYSSALRVSETLNASAEDFNFKSGILTLPRTKTGFKRCKCSKWEKRQLIEVDKNCDKCLGIGKIRKKQLTTISPLLPSWVVQLIKSKEGKLFPFTRQLIWSYYKKAANMAGLELGEQQDDRYVEGAWTHLLRKSYSKLMKFKGANRDLRNVKLRHVLDTQERYDQEDINSLIEWERENL